MSAQAAPDRVFIRGISQPLPAGEKLLWQGAPDTRSLLLRAFHLRWALAWFGAMALLGVVAGAGGGVPVAARVTWLVVLGGVVAGMLATLAWLTTRTTVYAITDRRVVFRIGIALPAVINLPLEKVGGVWRRSHPDGTGDLALSLRGTRGIGYLLLWPHARPWKVAAPEPMLRCVPDVDGVGTLLRDAVLAVGALDRPEGPPSPVVWDLTGEADDPCGGHVRPSFSLPRTAP